MSDYIINILYELLKDSNVIKYPIDKIENILGEKVINITLENATYTISCLETFRGAKNGK